ncbi:MAG: glycosyltransferase family 2 protein [Bacteroidetes bacterium]|nr:glycosyltransferase family 2 protein [Bacteroidota bacterium]
MNLVSIVCTTYNEEKLIAKTLDSFLSQQLDNMQLEIFVVDGRSEDKTREIIKSYETQNSRIKLIDNPERKNPFGRNIGIQESNGNYIAILGAHTIYKNDYIKTCIAEMERTGSAGVSGKVVTSIEKDSNGGELCELILTSKFGVSGESFRTVKEGYTSMVNFPVFKREVFEEVGLYDTELHRNQDNDLNNRIMNAGYKLYNTWKTECYYYPEDTLKGLYKYSYRNGFWNAKSLLENPESMKLHHYIPFAFVVTIIIMTVFAILGLLINSGLQLVLLAGAIGVHLFAGLLFSVTIKKYKSLKNILSLPFLFFAFHFSYGWGTLRGLFSKTI